jgi:hypothetical protein
VLGDDGGRQYAFVFPGQGSQRRGMLDAVPETEDLDRLLDAAEALTDLELRAIAALGTDEDLADTRAAQPLLYLCDWAWGNALIDAVLSPDALASQIDLLVIEDLPEAERSVRAEADRALTVHDLYMKYLDPVDLATYLPVQSIWAYESNDSWWKWEPTAGTRALMATELRSIRRHGILTDSEILDLLGEETLEQHLSLAVRTGLRKAARRAAAAGKPFTDEDLFAGPGAGARDLIDEMVDSVPMPQLRDVVAQAGRILGASELDDNEEPTAVTFGGSRDAAAVPTPIGQRIGPRPMPAVTPAPSLLMGKPRTVNDRNATPPPKPIPAAPPAKAGRPAPIPADAAGPPQPDDDLAFLEEISGRVL